MGNWVMDIKWIGTSHHPSPGEGDLPYMGYRYLPWNIVYSILFSLLLISVPVWSLDRVDKYYDVILGRGCSKAG